MALATYATEHGDITLLTANQLEKPGRSLELLNLRIEEITKMISTESASISTLIPLVKILEKALNKHDDDS